MDRSELLVICERVVGGRDRDARVVALALRRFLVGVEREVKASRRDYQRRYMREYRAGKRRRGVVNKVGIRRVKVER